MSRRAPPASAPSPAPSAVPAAAAPPATPRTPAARPLRSRGPYRSRRLRSQPMQGWGLIVRACSRLGIWDQVASQLVCREFAAVCRAMRPQLDPYLRAESFKKDSGLLLVRAANSSALNEFQYVKDLFMSEINARIERMAKNIKKHKENARLATLPDVQGFLTAVGPLHRLPDFKYWQSYPRRSAPVLKPAQRVDTAVVAAIGQIQDSELRQRLSAMYSSAIAGSNLPID